MDGRLSCGYGSLGTRGREGGQVRDRNKGKEEGLSGKAVGNWPVVWWTRPVELSSCHGGSTLCSVRAFKAQECKNNWILDPMHKVGVACSRTRARANSPSCIQATAVVMHPGAVFEKLCGRGLVWGSVGS